MNGVDGMLYIQSTNANDGTMTQNVTFDVDTNIDIDNVLVQNRFSQAQTYLPQDVKNFGVTIKKSLTFPLMVIGAVLAGRSLRRAVPAATTPSSTSTTRCCASRASATCATWAPATTPCASGSSRTCSRALGLTVSDVQAAIQRAERREPGRPDRRRAGAGRASSSRTPCAPRGGSSTPEEFGDIVVRAEPGRLRSSGSATWRASSSGRATYTQFGTFNGKPAAVIAVFQSPGSNALDVAAAVRATMQELKARFPPGMDYAISLDTTAPVKAGIKEIVETLLEAILLVVLVVFIFLQSWRATLIPLLTVPVSLIGAFAVFPLLGFSVNTLSLFGLVLAIGLVVDDAIVVVEAVEHHIEEGLSPRDATQLGDVGGAGAGDRHRADPGRGLRSGRLHERHHRAPLPAVRAHHRHLRAASRPSTR